MSEKTKVPAEAAGAAPQDRPPIDIMSLYHRDMNIYGDSGNILTVARRAALYGFAPAVHYYDPGGAWPEQVDLILGGGGQDQGQGRIMEDLAARGPVLHALADDGTPMLMICGLYQLFGDYFQTSAGDRLEGIGIIGAHTVGRDRRMIGNLVDHTDGFGDVIGYENHSGQTYLDDGVRPLGTVDAQGCGNNGEDRTEGARVGNVIGTYMHGSLLPKNPAVADFLIRAAVDRRYGKGAFVQQAASLPEENRREIADLDDLASRASRVAASRPR